MVKASYSYRLVPSGLLMAYLQFYFLGQPYHAYFYGHNRSMGDTSEIYLSVGTNLGDKINNLSIAIQMLEQLLNVKLICSPIYETAPWGNTDQPGFLNVCLSFQSSESPQQILAVIKEIESAMGRVRIEKWGTRIIDIDIIFCGSLVFTTPELTIPHPHLQDRKFVLVPLNDIAPGFVHPVLQKTVKQLLETCMDNTEVYPLGNDTSYGS